jgi:hypothetical protein
MYPELIADRTFCPVSHGKSFQATKKTMIGTQQQQQQQQQQQHDNCQDLESKCPIQSLLI